MKHFFLLFLFIGSSKLIIAQTSVCGVMADSLKGTYEGGCDKGKANGAGKAVGVDTYEGDFKNGLPDGLGKYVWKNGTYYDGAWKKGMKEGKGEMHYKIKYKDSVVAGFWKKDIYKGEYENPYTIHNVTSEMGRVGVSKMGQGNAITITVENLIGGGFQSTTTMTNFQITRGQFISKSSNTLTNKEITIFRGVIFPFRGTFNFGNSIFEIEIFEVGSWDINIPINK
ncbi:hypothetical protein [Ferruginibacter sp.]